MFSVSQLISIRLVRVYSRWGHINMLEFQLLMKTGRGERGVRREGVGVGW